jgi:hypothetical protein
MRQVENIGQKRRATQYLFEASCEDDNLKRLDLKERIILK